MQPLTEDEKKVVVKAVKEQFEKFISVLNKIDTAAWASFYSDDSPVTSVASVDVYGDKKAWVETVEVYFSQRKTQVVESTVVQVTPLAHDLALLVSEEKVSITQKNGKVIRWKHVFSMIWKNEKNGWKILHSHESEVEY